MDEAEINVIKLGFVTFEGNLKDFLFVIICSLVIVIAVIALIKILLAFIGAVWRIIFTYVAVPFTIYQFGIRMVTKEYTYLPVLLCIVYVVIVLFVDPFDRSGRKRARREEYDDESPPRRRRSRCRT